MMTNRSRLLALPFGAQAETARLSILATTGMIADAAR